MIQTTQIVLRVLKSAQGRLIREELPRASLRGVDVDLGRYADNL